MELSCYSLAGQEMLRGSIELACKPAVAEQQPVSVEFLGEKKLRILEI